MYQYSPLRESTGEIRLLVLHPGTSNSDITCSIQHADLTDSLRFTALSYTWGDPKICKSVLVDGQTLEVTTNLFDALRYLRSTQELQLWIDAICINQADLNERNKQVLRMKDIYAIAETVEVWLGLADEDDQAAMELVKRLGATVPDPEEPLAGGFDSRYDESFLRIFEASRPQEVRALSALFKRPWWSRVWVVQELAIANQQAAIVRCGEANAPWLSFLLTAYAIESSWFIVDAIITTNFPEEVVDKFNHGIRMAQCRRVDTTHPSFTLLELLHQHRDCEATDPKDKVYGLLGLAGDVDDIGLMPDYDLSSEEIFTDLFKKHVTSTKSLDMICAVRFPRRFDDLPSWVPDWSVDQMVPGICINDRYIGGNDFVGSPIPHFQKYATSGVSVAQTSFSGTQMSVAGICFGVISSLGRVDEGMAFDDLESFGREDENGRSASDSNTFNEWLNLILDSPLWDEIAARYGEENVIDAFCRTLVGNRNNRMMEPPEQVKSESDVQINDVELEEFPDQGNENNSNIEVQECQDRNDTPTLSGDDILFSPHKLLSMTVDGFRSCIQVAWGKRIAICEGGYVGLVPKQAEVGDTVAVLLGCTMPLVLRRNRNSIYSVIGESYVHGVMDGEVVDAFPAKVLILE